jgi:hypothetical protein
MAAFPTWRRTPRARAAAQKAQELEPDAPRSHRSLGIIEHYYGWDVAREERELRLATLGNPHDADAHFWLTLCLCLCSGRRRTRPRPPARAPSSSRTPATRRRREAGFPPPRRRYDEALPIFEKAVEKSPTAVFPLWSLGTPAPARPIRRSGPDTLARVVQVTDRAHFYELALYGAGAPRARPDRRGGCDPREMDRGRRRSYVPPFDRALLMARWDATRTP